MNLDFLPMGFENLRMEKPYLSLSKLPEGDHKMRIVARPIAGWIDWKENKPLRFRPEEKPKMAINPDKPIKPFWVCHVWNYSKEALFVMEITQSSILKSLASYGSDEDWGDFRNYDVKITKKGSGKETEYMVTPLPHKPLSEVILKAVQSTPIRLEALYEGKDPWTDLEESNPFSDEVNDSRLSELQRLELAIWCGKNEDLARRIEAHLGTGPLSEIHPKHFDRVVAQFKKGAVNGSAAMA